ncbi:molecular chaperone DnaJ, partial [Patescibacteria group bacterium]|nr:molecular chaperone DnaJ [Patescibacteria group bacterium]
MAKDYYKILGIEKNAGADEIKKAYRKLAHKYHPDKGGGKEDEEKFKEINEAYQVLSDPAKRSSYDQFGNAGFAGGFGRGAYGPGGVKVDFDFGEDLGDIFDTFFGGGFGRRGGGRPKDTRGRDISYSVEIDFLDVVFGKNIELALEKVVECRDCEGTGAKDKKLEKCGDCQGTGQVERVQSTILGSFRQVGACAKCSGTGKFPKQVCHTCRGEGRVKEKVKEKLEIPKGVEDGMVLRLRGRGEAAVRGGQAGDLMIRVKIKPDDFFQRKGNDVLTDEHISFAQAVLGDQIEVRAVDGKRKMRVPAGIQSQETLVIAGLGVPFLGNDTKRGDQIVKIIVDVPNKLSREQKDLIREYARVGGEEIQEEGMVDKVR